MIHAMRFAATARKLVVTLACLLPLVAAPAPAVAQDVDLDYDGRLDGYGQKLMMDGGNRAMTWFGFGVLAVIALLALFKDAKRSHLD